jgi:hypothetical protein
MENLDVELLKDQITKTIDQWYLGQTTAASPANEDVQVPARVLPEGKRAVRTKSSGDRVYILDDNKKVRQWATNPEIVKDQGFEMGDVVEVEDNELLNYQMGPALYRIENRVEPDAKA